MRITIITIGSRGDVQPYIALGLGLKNAKHEVRLATSANFAAAIRRRGLDFFPIEGEPQAMLQSETGQAILDAGSNPFLFARRFFSMLASQMKQLLSDCWEACEGTEAMVFSLTGFYIGYHVAEKLKVPFYPAYLQPVHPSRYLSSVLFPEAPGWLPLRGSYNLLTHALGGQLVWQMLRRATNKARREILNLPPVSLMGPFGQLIKQHHPYLYGFSPMVLPKPLDWDANACVTGYWFLDHPPGWHPPANLIDFLESGSPPVCVGFGSMINRNPEESTQLVLDALRSSGQRGILLTGWGGLSSADLPDDVFKMDDVPHDWLFPRAAAVVHHGGAGTTAAGLRAGVPSIVVPFFADQNFWGQRVHKLGAGPKPMQRKKLSTERLANAIRVATNDEGMRRRAAIIGAHMLAENGVAQAVKAFSSLKMG